jgi:hypothetical protein
MSTVTIRFDGEEYRVPGPDGTEAQAYYTDDRTDAMETAALEHPRATKIQVRLVETLDPEEG